MRLTGIATLPVSGPVFGPVFGLVKACAIAAPLLLLASCGDDAPVPDAAGGEASGEVLEGTISDAMIPTDSLRSQPPLERLVPDTAAGAGEGAGAAPEGEAAEAEDAMPEAGATAAGEPAEGEASAQ